MRGVLNQSVRYAQTSSMGRSIITLSSKCGNDLPSDGAGRLLAADRRSAEDGRQDAPEEIVHDPRNGSNDESLDARPDGLRVSPARPDDADREQHVGRGDHDA